MRRVKGQGPTRINRDVAIGLYPRQNTIMDKIKTGKYRHFKGNEYEVIAIARHSETAEDMVVYKALYGDGGLWVRPASMWNETVERDGKVFRRFEYTGE